MGATQPNPAPCRVFESPLHWPDKHSLTLCLHTPRVGALTPCRVGQLPGGIFFGTS